MTTFLKISIVFILSCSQGLHHTSQAFAEEPIKIAVILAITGSSIDSDDDGWQGALLAAEQINSQGGIVGRRVEVLKFDTFSTPIGAIKAARGAVNANVAGVVGANWSSQTLPIAKVMQQAGIPLITPSATHPDITKTGDYIFRRVFTDTFQGSALAKFAYADLQASTAVVLRNVSETYSMSLTESFTSSFNSYGGEVLWQGDYKTNTSDFSNILEKVGELAPEVVFLPSYERDGGIILRQAGALGLELRFLGGDGWERNIADLAGEAADGSFYLAQWHHESPEPESKKLVALYYRLEQRNNHPSSIFAMTFDTVSLLIDAIKRAGSVDRKEIQKALSQTKDYQTSTGLLTFDSNGDPVSSYVSMLQFVNGEAQFYKALRLP